MKRFMLLYLTVFSFGNLLSQEIDSDLLKIKQNMDRVEEFTAQLQLDLDISFINMPTKTAVLHYKKGEAIKIASPDFMLIPKRGLDFGLNEIFKHPFITVNRDAVMINGQWYKVINVIPTDRKADFAIATLVLDTVNNRVIEMEISTKKEGTYTLAMSYENSRTMLPNKIVVSFEIENIKIPLNYMGKDVKVNKNELKLDETKTGKIILTLSEYKIVLTE